MKEPNVFKKALASTLQAYENDIRKECAKAGQNWLRGYFYFENKAGLSSGESLCALKQAILNAGKSPEGEEKKNERITKI